jgi:nucleolar protein 56
MKLYIVEHLTGAYALDEEKKIVDYQHATKDIDENVEEALRYERGEPPHHLQKLIERLKDKSEFVLEKEDVARALSKTGVTVSAVEPHNEIARSFRERVEEVSISTGFVSSKEELYEFIQKVMVEYTRRKLRKAAMKRDLLAAQAIRAIDDLDKTYNLFVIRLREWYSIHFPELDSLVPSHEQYVKLVANLGHRENFTIENLKKLGFPVDKAEKISEAARESMGADLSDFDISPIQTIARMAHEISILRKELSGYIDNVMREVAPNITALVGSLIGARLISLAGSLENLAKLPASTIQVLGAEKALFRALRSGGRPPKHGIIFQYPEVHKSPRWQRGKIARTLASKLAIAAKVDAFTGRWIGDKLVEELRKRIEEIKKLYAKPPERKEAKPAIKPAEGRSRGKKRKKKGRKKKRRR